MTSTDDMLNSIANTLGKMGMNGFEFVDEGGNVKASYTTKKPALPSKPLIGFGDSVKVGDRVVVGVWYDGKFACAEFDGEMVEVVNYGDKSDPFMLVKRGDGSQPFFNYTGNGFRREFKVVKHG